MVPRDRPKCQSTGKTEKHESVKVNKSRTKACLPSKTRSAWPRAGARDSLLVRTHWTIPALRESFFEEIKSLYRNSFLFAFRKHHLGCLFEHLRQWHIDSPLLRSFMWDPCHLDGLFQNLRHSTCSTVRCCTRWSSTPLLLLICIENFPRHDR